MKLSEVATWDEAQCAAYLAIRLANPEDDFDVVVNDVWLESVGNLHDFADRLRSYDNDAYWWVFDAMNAHDCLKGIGPVWGRWEVLIPALKALMGSGETAQGQA